MNCYSWPVGNVCRIWHLFPPSWSATDSGWCYCSCSEAPLILGGLSWTERSSLPVRKFSVRKLERGCFMKVCKDNQNWPEWLSKCHWRWKLEVPLGNSRVEGCCAEEGGWDKLGAAPKPAWPLISQAAETKHMVARGPLCTCNCPGL